MFYEASKVALSPDGREHVRVRFPDGKEVGRVRLKRLFPLSRANLFIRMVDEAGSEIGIIKDIRGLDPDSKKTALDTLERFYIIPKISEIYNLYDSHGTLFWDVETDRGRRDFQVRSTTKDMTRFPTGRVLIRDLNSNQYEIPDHKNLPRKSRQLLESWI